jgi:hypothetical protein
VRVLLALVETVGLLLGLDDGVALGALYVVSPLTGFKAFVVNLSYLVTRLVDAARSDVGLSRHVEWLWRVGWWWFGD